MKTLYDTKVSSKLPQDTEQAILTLLGYVKNRVGDAFQRENFLVNTKENIDEKVQLHFEVCGCVDLATLIKEKIPHVNLVWFEGGIVTHMVAEYANHFFDINGKNTYEQMVKERWYTKTDYPIIKPGEPRPWQKILQKGRHGACDIANPALYELSQEIEPLSTETPQGKQMAKPHDKKIGK